MKQLAFIEKSRREHGGSLALGRRRSKRPIALGKPVHIVLRSDLAKRSRSLIRNRWIVEAVITRYSKRFRIRVYEKAICGNHIHLLVKAETRRELQHFFRVTAGQIAQGILTLYPLQKFEEKAFWGGTPPRGGLAHPKNQRSFWSVSLYSRIVTWGQDYMAVKAYVLQNNLEALGLVIFKERRSSTSTMKAPNSS